MSKEDKSSEPMSSSYAEGLSPYENKGKLGLKELFDTKGEISEKINLLADWIKESKYVVFHTGAGISTSAGIPDFRGPQGVWTLEAKGLKPNINISFNDAVPTKTHMALKLLLDEGYVKFVISQNIDGLHMRSGMDREGMAELHGNMFTEQCNQCDRMFVRMNATTSVGQRDLGKKCPGVRPGNRGCRGKIHDTILDWEANLPERELSMAEWHSGLADLSVTLGTTLQILPSGNLPLLAKKRNNGRVVVCNLQPTKHDKKADLLIHAYVDEIMEGLLKRLNLKLPEYNHEFDPVKQVNNDNIIEWTISSKSMKLLKRTHEEHSQIIAKRRKLEIKKIKNDVKEEIEEDEICISEETNSYNEDKIIKKEEIFVQEKHNKNNEKQEIITRVKEKIEEQIEITEIHDNKSDLLVNEDNSEIKSEIADIKNKPKKTDIKNTNSD